MLGDMPIIAFLPCRQGSKRVIKKNTRQFGDTEGGLVGIKLQQLIECPFIDRIVLSTDDKEVMEIGRVVAEKSATPIELNCRPAHLAADSTSTDDLVRYVPEIIPHGVALWTHVTSPFLTVEQYNEAIIAYKNNVNKGEYDSLMSVTKIQTFLWDETGPINYDRAREKWPASQSLPEYFEINSGIFMIDIDLMRRCDDRVGARPFLYEMSHLNSFDIDTESQFELASNLWRVIANS